MGLATQPLTLRKVAAHLQLAMHSSQLRKLCLGSMGLATQALSLHTVPCRLLKACTLTPISTENHGDGLVEPVRWSQDSSRGVVLVTGMGFGDHVVTFGPGYMARGQVGPPASCMLFHPVA